MKHYAVWETGDDSNSTHSQSLHQMAECGELYAPSALTLAPKKIDTNWIEQKVGPPECVRTPSLSLPRRGIAALLSVCVQPTSCFAPGQNAGRVTHEPDRVRLLSSRQRSEHHHGGR
jgi:hypothetical protein